MLAWCFAFALSGYGYVANAASTTTDINFSAGFSASQGQMILNGSGDLAGTALQLTNGGQDQAGSAFYTTPVNIQAFTTNFTFQLSNPSADGFTFTIQSVSPVALGMAGGYLGYAGIPVSVAVKFDLYSNQGEGSDSTGLYTDGAAPTVPAIDLSSTGINLHSGDPMAVHITYDGTNLSLTITDAVTLATWSHAFAVNIPSIVGGDTAYVGFTGGTGGLTSTQQVLSWAYVAGTPSVPSYPAGYDAAGLTLNGSAAIAGTALQLTNGGQDQAGSAFYTPPVNIQAFTTNFTFQLSNPSADGMTFTIQSVGSEALGYAGDSLGYAGIGQSVAVKFDLYSNAGEGPDSTGLYTDGAAPTVPALDLSSTGINLHSGDPMAVHIAYDGTNLSLTITDAVTLATWSSAFPVNIPAIVGGDTAYVGFTGGTGGLTSTQQVMSWTYVAGLTPISFAQLASATPQSPTDSVSASYPAAQTLGDLNVVVVGWDDTVSTVQSVKDSAGNTYRLAIGPTSGTGLLQSIYYASNIVGGTNT